MLSWLLELKGRKAWARLVSGLGASYRTAHTYSKHVALLRFMYMLLLTIKRLAVFNCLF